MEGQGYGIYSINKHNMYVNKIENVSSLLYKVKWRIPVEKYVFKVTLKMTVLLNSNDDSNDSALN